MRFSPKDCGLTEETASGFRLETMRSICRTALIGSMHARFWHTLGRSATLFSAKQKARFLPPWFDAFSRPGSGIALRHPAIRQVHMPESHPARKRQGAAVPARFQIQEGLLSFCTPPSRPIHKWRFSQRTPFDLREMQIRSLLPK